MGRTKRWKMSGIKDGILDIQLSSWQYFHDFISKKMLDYNHYVWRGDRCDDRPLLPTFDRNHKSKNRKTIEGLAIKHLQTFKLATRGRRGTSPSKIETENDWWALGQHYGLTTPLLDWTRSPFVALFFAFEKNKTPQTSNRIIYAITPSSCERKTKEITDNHKTPDRPDIVEFFTPPQDENNRLVNQNGLFSRCTAGTSIENWIVDKFKDKQDGAVLIRIKIPNTGREECLRTLNKMNINHLTLYPDLLGASNYSNFSDKIAKY